MSTYHVTTASGADVTVVGDRAELDTQTSAVNVYSGDALVASFRSFTSIWTEPDEG